MNGVYIEHLKKGEIGSFRSVKEPFMKLGSQNNDNKSRIF